MPKPGYLTFRLAPEDYARLADIAQRKGYSLSEMARKCLRSGLRLSEDFEPKASDYAVQMRQPSERVA